MDDDDTFSPLQFSGAVLGDEVYRVLAEAILAGRLSPGQRLRDVELAQQLGVSRTPIREALQRLERLGLVEVAANRWTRVTTPAERAYDDTQEFMNYIVGDAFHLALARCSDETLDTLVSLAEDIAAAARSGNGMAVLGATIVFFQQTIRATNNGVFVTILREAGMTLQRNLQGRTPPEPTPDVAANWERLRDAVRARDAVLAEQLLLGSVSRG